MYELNTVAIVRYCARKNAAPKLGFLSPHIKKDYEVQCVWKSITETFPKVQSASLKVHTAAMEHSPHCPHPCNLPGFDSSLMAYSM